MQRAREQDSLETDFEEACGKPPRTVQRELLPLLHKHTMGGTRILVAELPTGTGKTYFGLTASYWTRETGRTLYVCHTLTLQTQLAHDVSKLDWIKSPVVLFGRDHYICQRRLAIVDLEKIVTSEPNRCYVLDALRKLSLEFSKPSTEYNPWFSSTRERARDMLREVLDEVTFSNVWATVSAKGCKCHNHGTGRCTHRHLSIEARTAQFVILNSSILMTLAARDKLDEFLCGEGRRPVGAMIIDEAHTLAEASSALYEGLLPRPFCVSDTANTVAEWHKRNASFTTGELKADHFRSLFSKQRAAGKGIAFANPVFSECMMLRPVWASGEFTPIRDTFYRHMGIYKKVCEHFNIEIPAELDDSIDEEDGPPAPDGKTPGISRPTPADTTGELDTGVKKETSDKLDKSKSWTTLADTTLNGYPQTQELVRKLNATGYVVADGPAQILAMLDKEMVQFCQAAHPEHVAELVRAADDPTSARSLKKTLRKVIDCIRSIETCNVAQDRDAWMESDNKNIVPKLSITGIDYESTMAQKAQLLLTHFWTPITKAGVYPICMSATLAQWSLPTAPWDSFFKEVGLETLRPTIAPKVESSFDMTRVTIVRPPMESYYFKWSTAQKDEYVQKRGAVICTYEPKDKAILVVATRDEQILFRTLLTRTLPHRRCFCYGEQRRIIDAMIQNPDTDWSTIILLGSDLMATGLNLPGRVGLVVIARPQNRVPNKEEQCYLRTYRSYTTESFYERSMYERQRRLVQAAGRLMRTGTDTGTILLLGHNPSNKNNETDLRELCTRYTGAAFSE